MPNEKKGWGLSSVVGTSTELWAVGVYGTLEDGHTGSFVDVSSDSNTTLDLHGIAGDGAGGFIFAGRSGIARQRRAGSPWSSLPLGTSAHLDAVWCTSTDVVFVGEQIIIWGRW